MTGRLIPFPQNLITPGTHKPGSCHFPPVPFIRVRLGLVDHLPPLPGKVGLDGGQHLDGPGVVDEVEKGDFVYFDPPYAPLSVTSSFTAYTKQGFDYSDQEALREVCHRLDKKGVFFMLSNSSNPHMLELYSDFTVQTVAATRAINSKASDRGPVSEIIVTNY